MFFMLLWHFARRAASRADCTAGSSRATRIPMIAMTTNSSTSVKPARTVRREEIVTAVVPQPGIAVPSSNAEDCDEHYPTAGTNSQVNFWPIAGKSAFIEARRAAAALYKSIHGKAQRLSSPLP
jgi:hypothetical protein